jgi:hypothetical protein
MPFPAQSKTGRDKSSPYEKIIPLGAFAKHIHAFGVTWPPFGAQAKACPKRLFRFLR